MPVYTLRYVVLGTRPWHQWTQHQGAPWQRAFSSVTPAVFGPFMPVMCICSLNYSIMYQKSNVQEGNLRKGGALGRENSLTGGLFGALNRARAWTGAGPGVEKKHAPPQAIDRGGELRWGPAGFGASEAPYRPLRECCWDSRTLSPVVDHDSRKQVKLFVVLAVIFVLRLGCGSLFPSAFPALIWSPTRSFPLIIGVSSCSSAWGPCCPFSWCWWWVSTTCP